MKYVISVTWQRLEARLSLKVQVLTYDQPTHFPSNLNTLPDRICGHRGVVSAQLSGTELQVVVSPLPDRVENSTGQRLLDTILEHIVEEISIRLPECEVRFPHGRPTF